jgi:BirA family biotin operon repressor/biotin-[acetyl-CoA-carboxylase] ligase
MIDALTEIGRDDAARARLAGRWGVAAFDFHDEIDSTQNALRAMADAGAPGWSLVAADHQSSGRGQQGRRWMAHRGASLTFSLLLRLDRMEPAALLPIRCGLAIASALDLFLLEGMSTMLKWPNDLIVAGGKAGGILCEAQMRGDEGAVIVGVGINVEPFALELDESRDLPPIFLRPHLKPATTRLDLLDAIILSLRRSLTPKLSHDADVLDDSEMSDYARRDWLAGRALAGPATGVARGITSSGLLSVETSGGAIATVASGRVVLRTC